MNEAETRAEHIDPALTAVGWGVEEGSKVFREHHITLGRIQGAGRRAKPEIADYVLSHRNTKLAVIEAKAWDKPLTEGVQQAKSYAQKLGLRFAYSTNGQGIWRIDMQTGSESQIDRFPPPLELWNDIFSRENAWRDRFAAVPTENRSGSWTLRYYQEIAIERVLEKVATNQQRILLTLATGTGKTSIAFQIAWKLFQARWSLGREPVRRPRILFLADRNTLANQAFSDFTSFAAFEDEALVRIDPENIRKRGGVPKNGSVFFTIFQTFMTGQKIEVDPDDSSESDTTESDKPKRKFNFGEYPRDFFDFIIIDECHRGGAQDESTWRDILEYFEPAVQLGLTATPKRKDNADTYAYFGEPVYIYSLKEGINDGFLTPFKVKQISTTLDEYVYTPDDKVIDGDIVEGKKYTESDFNRNIEIKQREAHRVKLFLDQINPLEKTIVFCAKQEHALLIRDLVNQYKKVPDPDYCVRVTANDGALGEQHLKTFQNNEKTIPCILTTSQKLSTGVNARNVRNIVLLRPVESMIEFKQIIGRGTRLFDGKEFFTIYDFVKAHEHFLDPEWDGEPLDPEPKVIKPPKDPAVFPGGEDVTPPGELDKKPRAARVILADGKERLIQHMVATSYWSADGKPISGAQLLEALFGVLPDLFHSEQELREIWSLPETRKALLQGLEEKGFDKDRLLAMQHLLDADRCDLYDVLSYVAYAKAPVTRGERADSARREIQGLFNERQRQFVDFVLTQYEKVGVEELEQEKLKELLKLKYRAISDAIEDLGDGNPDTIRELFIGFQRYLYTDAA